MIVSDPNAISSNGVKPYTAAFPVDSHNYKRTEYIAELRM